MNTYDILIQPSVTAAFDALPAQPHHSIVQRLAVAAHAATAPRRAGTIGQESRGLHRGLHRANVGNFWIIYRVDHEQRSIFLISFGDRRLSESTRDENRWENEGGTSRH